MFFKSFLIGKNKYKINEFGEVYSFDSLWDHPSGKGICKKRGRKLSIYRRKDGYCQVNIQKKTYLLHRLLFCVFNNLEYDGNFFIGHYDDDGSNNVLSNLYYIPKLNGNKENQIHKINAYKVYAMYLQGKIKLPKKLEKKLKNLKYNFI